MAVRCAGNRDCEGADRREKLDASGQVLWLNDTNGALPQPNEQVRMQEPHRDLTHLVARAARPAEPRVVSAFPRVGGSPTAAVAAQKGWRSYRPNGNDSGSRLQKRTKAEMTLGSAGLAARATPK